MHQIFFILSVFACAVIQPQSQKFYVIPIILGILIVPSVAFISKHDKKYQYMNGIWLVLIGVFILIVRDAGSPLGGFIEFIRSAISTHTGIMFP